MRGCAQTLCDESRQREEKKLGRNLPWSQRRRGADDLNISAKSERKVSVMTRPLSTVSCLAFLLSGLKASDRPNKGTRESRHHARSTPLVVACLLYVRTRVFRVPTSQQTPSLRMPASPSQTKPEAFTSSSSSSASGTIVGQGWTVVFEEGITG